MRHSQMGECFCPSQLSMVSEDPSIGNCLSRIATRQLLRQSDALQQALQLSEGGGWKGGHFDRHTAQKCMKMIDQEQGDCEESKQMSPNLGTLSSPTVIRRRRPLSPKGRVFRASTIENWSLNWLENRENRQSM
ncbi:unnamed protein product [Durusdinium trenchii]|uniref:Uncharacterized protein n=2 Tax=Durusdinium trenchii TaxID=1381693 RepID=A0ABP0L292_9DINO